MSLHPDLSEDLTKAAMWGNLKLLDSLLENGADPNFPNAMGNSPLHEAAYYGEIECANSLLEYKATVNIPGHGGKTPLHKAVSGVLGQVPSKQRDSESKIHDNQMSIVKLLVAHGADLKMTDETGLTPRELAMQCDFYECADLIDDLERLQTEQKKERLRQSRIKGLFCACESGDIDMLKETLPHIPEAINDFVYEDENLLMCAARNGHLHIVEHLLDNGAVAVASRKLNKTALHLACQAGHAEVVVCLLNRLPALLVIDDSPRETSLHIAARYGHVDIVRNLLAVAARAQQLKSRDNSCEDEAYLYANETSKIVMNDSLPEMTLDVMALSEQEKKTPLHEASINGHVAIVKLLIEHLMQYHKPDVTPTGNAPQNRSTRGFSPLSKVSSPTHGSKKGPNSVPGIDTMTLKGRTAFHEAAKQGHLEVMKVLLQAGADINAFMRLSIDTNINTDLTALVQACLMGKKDIVHFLLQHCATDARLKALKRTLSIPDNYIAGLLLCYNGGVREITLPKRAQKSPSRVTKPPENTPLEVTWKSKNLQYICSDWLTMATKLPEFENKTSVVTQLDVSSNSLTELPIEVFQLPHLVHLDASRNQVKVLPVEESKKNCGWNCCRLSQLDVTTNHLSSLPCCLFSLPELKEINANGNMISYVPASVWSAPKLTKLYVARNLLVRFPSERRHSDCGGSPGTNPLGGSVFSPLDNLPEDSTNLDSGYRSNPTLELVSPGSSHSDDNRELPSFYLPYSSSQPMTKNRTFSERRETIHTQAVVSRRLESFHDTSIAVEELEDLESTEEGEDKTNFCLEVLDLAGNQLTCVPPGLSCLAPRLQKLNVSKNQIKSLGTINDYPFEIELLDASNNELHSAIAPSPSGHDYRYCLPCARKPYVSSSSASQADASYTFSYKPCSHRSHKNLRKLTTFKLNKNQLYDLQLFKHIGRKSKGSDLVSSLDDSVVEKKSRSNTTADFLASQAASKSAPPVSDVMTRSMNPNIVIRSSTVGNKKDFLIKKNSAESALAVNHTGTGHDATKSSGSNHSSGSREGSGSDRTVNQLIVISPLYPQLSTLEVANNQLRYVPSYIHCVSNLSCLVISYNPDIDTLPLELSNCEHLWNLEYEGCPLTNPPAVDLNKFRLASDKLLYMKSLLHDAKPNESMKLMLVGLQKMGKTTLLSRLRDVNEEATPYTTFLQRVTGEDTLSASARDRRSSSKRKEPLSTVGVDLGIWKYRKDLEPEYLKSKKKGSKQLRTVTFYTWDFGGQEEYYATHQCFMSSRSLYLVVWDITLGSEGIEQLAPWLHNIQARAPGSPVVIVGTHCDKLKGDVDKERQKMKMNNVIYQKFLIGRGPQQLKEMGLPKILDVIYVGCPSIGRLEGVQELRMALYDIAFSLALPGKGQNAKMKLLEQPIPANFLKLEEKVRVLSVQCKKEETPPVLKETLFRDSTKDVIANPRELNQAVTFLHENGIMLHYDTPALGHLYFVDPQWLCDMLAHIVTVPEVNRFIQRQEGPEAGILRTSVLSHVFKGNVFPQAYRKEYVELLGKFEVALYLDRHRLLVPSMLPTKPRYTLHVFDNVFPRPNLFQILSQSPEASKLFSSPESTHVNDNRDLDQSQESVDGGIDTHLAVAAHMSEELFRTGLILRRFYFMTYVPSGFWPRLISRFLSSNEFGKILLRSLGYDKDQILEIMEQLVSGVQAGAVSLEWSYWKSGIELWYKGLSLLRVSEILPEGSFHDCKPSPSIFEQSATTPFEPAVDTADLSFDLNGLWMPVDMTPNRGIEIIIPDTVCLAMLQKEVEQMQKTTDHHTQPSSPDPGEESCDNNPTYPCYESRWMSAELLALSADYIDTLLEDWYPGLGAREGNKTMEAIPYVNRVIPCPFCVSGAVHLVDREDPKLPINSSDKGAHEEIFTDLSSTPTPGSAHPGQTTPTSKRYSRLIPSSLPLGPDPMDLQEESPSNQLADEPTARRSLFKGQQKVRRCASASPEANKLNRLDELPEEESVLNRSMSEKSPRNIPAGRRPTRKGSLADINRSRMQNSDSDKEALASPLEEPLLPKPTVGSELGLTLASKFGFMIESCIVASRQCQELVCPAHMDHPLSVTDIAPDLVFADLPRHFILDPACVDKGEYIDHGSFGDIYHGAVYPTPSATDDEGREVAIKIDRMDSKCFNSESATKAYVESRAEVSMLHRLQHPNIVDFIGVVLQPLCFILEWAPKGSLSSLFQKYRKVDARISPLALQQTAYQVASGLAYLHQHNIVYYDLKSPNILVFQFPSAQESIQATQGDGYVQGHTQPATDVLVKIADLGISRLLSPGGVMGFKGSPGFMAPEILKYVGMEACTEKIDVYSYGMFLFELIALHFPFEKQNLMGSQIEKLVIEGDRPPLQNRELNNPILYLDVMRWCWQQDFRSRPSAQQLTDILTNPSIPCLVDAVSLHNSSIVTCACICTLPIEIVPPAEMAMGESGDPRPGSFVPPSPHSHLAQGDLQEELWLCTYNDEGCGSEVCVINFKGKASQSFPACNAKITCICGVSYCMWLGTEEGQVFILDAVTKHTLLDRHLAVLPGQGISSIHHILANRHVLVTRQDGSILLFSEDIQEHKLPDISNYDNRVNSTQLPVRSVFKTPEKLPILCTALVSYPGESKKSLWCGTKYEMILIFDITAKGIDYCRKKYNRSRYEVLDDQEVSSLVVVEGEDIESTNVWALACPANMLYCWSVKNENLLNSIRIEQFTHETVTSLFAMRTQLQLALESGRILLLSINKTDIVSTTELRGHVKEIYQLLSIGGRVLPRHWLPTILGRSNVIDYYRDLLDEKDIKSITSTMVGHQTRLLVTIGYGYLGVTDRLIEPLMSFRDRQENFVLLWVINS